MIKGFIATLSVAVFMLVCLAVNVSAGYSGGHYGDYEGEECERVCYRHRPQCHHGSIPRLVGSCYTCCKIREHYYPYDDKKSMDMDQDHEMETVKEQPATDANVN